MKEPPPGGKRVAICGVGNRRIRASHKPMRTVSAPTPMFTGARYCTESAKNSEETRPSATLTMITPARMNKQGAVRLSVRPVLRRRYTRPGTERSPFTRTRPDPSAVCSRHSGGLEHCPRGDMRHQVPRPPGRSGLLWRPYAFRRRVRLDQTAIDTNRIRRRYSRERIRIFRNVQL